MRRDDWLAALARALRGIEAWEDTWPAGGLPELDDAATGALDELVGRLRDNYPFGHPRYAGQMLKPPHPLAWVAYTAAAVINPNNHALDGGPATAELELEAVAELARMLGYGEHLGHLTASGTVANLEALWVARQCHPGRNVAFATNAHYTHARMCEVLGIGAVEVATDADGRMDLGALEGALAGGDVGTVVATLGTTGLGALDPLDEIVRLAGAAGARVHADCAYGGFFALLAAREPPLVTREPFAALGDVDSIVIDPHKHGLQPYGCGCVLFRDPAVGRYYKHDSPYTYFTSDELHLGEITLECSRAGASAAALWTTLRAIPLLPDAGLGELLAAGRRAALAWAVALRASTAFRLVVEPETDILCFAPVGDTSSAISARSERLFATAMEEPAESVYLAMMRAPREVVEAHWPDVTWDSDSLTILRSVVMKPEHEEWWPRLHQRLEQLVAELA